MTIPLMKSTYTIPGRCLDLPADFASGFTTTSNEPTALLNEVVAYLYEANNVFFEMLLSITGGKNTIQ